MKHILTILIFYILVSCAGKAPELKDDKKDLTEVFRIEDDTLEKFKIVKKPTKKPVVPKKKRVKKKPLKKVKAKKVSKPKTQVNKVEVEQILNPEDAEGYPELYKKYNKRFAKQWDEFKPNFYLGEKLTMHISWSVFSAGDIDIEVLEPVVIAGKEAYVFKAHVESAEYFERIYKLKDTLHSYVSKENFYPIKYELKQRESSQSVDDLQFFDRENLKTYFWYKRLKEGKTTEKKKENFTPKFFNDSFSLLYFMRGLPMRPGKKFEFPVMTRTKIWVLKAEVKEKEVIEVMNKNFEAYKVRAETHYPGVLKRKGDFIIWISTDKTRKILKFEAKVKIGTVKGVLKDYRPGKLIK